MSVQLSSTTASSCVLTPLAASHVNVLLDLPNTIPPALVSGRGKIPIENVALPLRSCFLVPLLLGEDKSSKKKM